MLEIADIPQIPVIKGKWRHDGTEIVCGEFRMRIEACEKLTISRQKRIMTWICKMLNAAAGPHAVDEPNNECLAEANQVIERRIAKGRIITQDGNTTTHRIR